MNLKFWNKLKPIKQEQGARLRARARLEGEDVLRGALAAIDEDNPQWLALNEVLRRQMEIEKDSLLVPNLSNEAAQYNRGRLAGLESFQGTLVQAWQESRKG